ncbi:MAG TPA: hypothetical protein VF863_02860, partial [Candidatus Acidoferrum sp.]
MRRIKHLLRSRPPTRTKAGVFGRHLRRAYQAARCWSISVSISVPVLLILAQPSDLFSAPQPSAENAGVGNAKTAQAFANYVRAIDVRNNSELQRGVDLLWIDRLPEAARKRGYT